MSRVGESPIPLPQGVEVEIKGHELKVKGPKGELQRSFNPDLKFEIKDGQLLVSRPSDAKLYRALHGLTRSLAANMVEGVSKGFDRYLDIVGVGYRAQASGNKVILQVGYSHPVEVNPPPGIAITAEAPNRLKVSGIDKELVSETAAKVRAIRPPDAYKGKGLRYAGEKVRIKAGKAGRAGGKKK